MCLISAYNNENIQKLEADSDQVFILAQSLFLELVLLQVHEVYPSHEVVCSKIPTFKMYLPKHI